MDMGAVNYRRYLEGDNEGMVQLIHLYRDGLIFYLRGFVNDIHTAEELTEDTFVYLGIYKPKFNEKKAGFKTWLYTVARNATIDHLRKVRRRAEVPLESLREFDIEQRSLEQEYIRKESKILLHRAMQKLKDEYRQVLWLVYFEEFTLKEVSMIMKRSTHATEMLVSRARTSLKKILEKEGFAYEEL